MKSYNNTLPYKKYIYAFSEQTNKTPTEAVCLIEPRAASVPLPERNLSRRQLRLSARRFRPGGSRRSRHAPGSPRCGLRQFQEQGGTLPGPHWVSWKPIVSAIEAWSQPQGTITHFRRDRRQRCAGSSKPGCRRDCIPTVRADAQVDPVSADETNAATYVAWRRNYWGCTSERAAHVSREICPHTGCDDYRFSLLHTFKRRNR